MNARAFLRPILASLIFFAATAALAQPPSDDGYRLWLRYETVADAPLRAAYLKAIGPVDHGAQPASPSLAAAAAELRAGLDGLLGPAYQKSKAAPLLLGTPASHPAIAALGLDQELAPLGPEGYLLKSVTTRGKTQVVVAANTDLGALYGAFALLRHLQTHQPLPGLSIASAPRIQHRMLNHWDNLTRTTERVMAGASLWNWFDLPYYIEPYYIDYARACASIGINATVLTNVNANATILRPQYLDKVAALADAFRPYGVRVYLTARFSAPVEIDGLPTADPLDPAVQQWWKRKADEIYARIPDFGGFLVKANSEGQPGPQNYGRNHADGANLLADAVGPHGGIVIWRAFVYEAEIEVDRHKQAYDEFVALEGKFRENVLVQSKNGAIDFMPREPFHPLFGATPQTPQALELQITQEYLGGDVHLAFLAPMWKETLDSDTHARGPGSTVAKVVDGTVFNHQRSAIAGVSNVGNERNWTGHPLAAANWYAYGRLAWDHQISSEQIADEWTRMTFSNETKVRQTITDMLLSSHETVVSYSMPLGLHHIMAVGHHIGPNAWHDQGRPDWTSVYYHKADKDGVGFDRTPTGSNALEQYFPPVRALWGNPETIDEKYLLWFHHVPWTHKMASGQTLWDRLCLTYQRGVDEVGDLRSQWASLQGQIDPLRHHHVTVLLQRQEDDAKHWRDAILSYFQSINNLPLPAGVEPPAHDLQYYKDFRLYHVPGYPGDH